VSRLPSTHLSCLAGLNMPKYRAMLQRLGLFGWENLAHFQASLHRWASSAPKARLDTRSGSRRPTR